MTLPAIIAALILFDALACVCICALANGAEIVAQAVKDRRDQGAERLFHTPTNIAEIAQNHGR